MYTSSTVNFYTQIIVVQANAGIAVKTLSFGTANAQARSVWTRGMKIHLGSSKFSGKVASIKLQFLRYSFRHGPTCLFEAIFAMLETHHHVQAAQAPAAILPVPSMSFSLSALSPSTSFRFTCCCRPPKMIIVPQTIQISMNLGRQTTLYRQYLKHIGEIAHMNFLTLRWNLSRDCLGVKPEQ